jgi:hypothetical protein
LTGRVLEAQLLGQVVHQLDRHVQRIHQEHAQVSNRDDLEGEAQARVITTSFADQPPILVIEMEEPLQLHPRQRPEPAVALQTLADHGDMVADLPE